MVQSLDCTILRLVSILRLQLEQEAAAVSAAAFSSRLLLGALEQQLNGLPLKLHLSRLSTNRYQGLRLLRKPISVPPMHHISGLEKDALGRVDSQRPR